MLARLQTARIVCEIALQNLHANRWKTLIVGGIVAFGALLVVLGTSLTDAIDRAIRGSITGSYAGHIQVYSSRSREQLEVMGRFSAGLQDLEPLPDFALLERVASAVPNVKAIVPMGVSNAIVASSNTLDGALERLRALTRERLEGDASGKVQTAYRVQKEHVQRVVSVLGRDFQRAREIADAKTSERELDVMKRALEPEFWAGFERDPYGHLEFLENAVTPLASDSDILFVHYLGTDPGKFADSFERMKIVDGAPIPPGERGFLFSKYVYEDQLKLKSVRGLDKLKRARDEGKSRIADDPELQRIVRENAAGVQEIVLQVDQVKTEQLRTKLSALLGGKHEDELSTLLTRFFTTDDDNLEARYRFFYAELAPALDLYRVRIGDELTISAVTRSGYMHSASLKVYGTFAFEGLENSPLAGALNIMDLVSFRELYGFMTEERAQEIARLRTASGAREVARDRVEAELFASADAPPDVAMPSEARELAAVLAPLHGRASGQEQAARYESEQLSTGALLNAAILVHDEAQIEETASAIERAGRRAGLPLKAISWQQAAGVVGQLASLMRGLLYAAMLIVFLVALVVISNALVMATLERVREIGTLRAIGAQKRLVLAVLLLESLAVATASGLAGALLGASLVAALGKLGIPASNEAMTFFFSGARLYPQLGAPQLGTALALVLATCGASSIYPVWIALRVSPREAMQTED